MGRADDSHLDCAPSIECASCAALAQFIKTWPKSVADQLASEQSGAAYWWAEMLRLLARSWCSKVCKNGPDDWRVGTEGRALPRDGVVNEATRFGSPEGEGLVGPADWRFGAPVPLETPRTPFRRDITLMTPLPFGGGLSANLDEASGRTQSSGIVSGSLEGSAESDSAASPAATGNMHQTSDSYTASSPYRRLGRAKP